MRGGDVLSLLEASGQVSAHAILICEALRTLVAIRLDGFQSKVLTDIQFKIFDLICSNFSEVLLPKFPSIITQHPRPSSKHPYLRPQSHPH